MDARPGRSLGLVTATCLVIASMVGTGIFTSTGYQVKDVGSLTAILASWVIGGLTALCGALVYAELVAALPDNGGEYQLMSRIYHPAAGFVAGWSSLIVGFAAPCAAVALAFGKYLAAIFPGVPPVPTAIGILLILSAIHGFHVSAGSKFQDLFTIGKVALIVGFIVFGLGAGDLGRIAADTGVTFSEGILSSKFAIGLIYVAFAYSGWNAAAYVAGEIDKPERTLPLSLIIGTAIVTVLYVLMNVVFLSSAPPSALAGKVEVGYVAAIALFGESAGRILSAIIAVGLVSTLGAMIMTGARVAEAIGANYRKLSWLTGRTAGGAPFRAVALQTAFSLALLLSARFEVLLEYTGFTITIGLGLTVMGVFVLRIREPDLPRPYKTWGYPITPIIFGILSLWMVIGMMIQRPEIALAGLMTLVVGLVLYVLVSERTKP